MCLDVDIEHTLLREATPVARKPWTCEECDRLIEPGERYWLNVVHDWGNSDGLVEYRMCVHCWATIVYGSSLTGCPKNWWWGMIHSTDAEEGGFVGDILLHDGLSQVARTRMARTVEGRRRQWRTPTGKLMKPVVDPFVESSKIPVSGLEERAE